MQVLHVAGVDLVERRVLRAARLAGVAAPFSAGRALLRRGRRREEKGSEESSQEDDEAEAACDGPRTVGSRHDVRHHWSAAGGSANVTSRLLPSGASSSDA